MPVTLTVSQIRQHIYQAERIHSETGNGSPTVSILGQWFHEGMSVLTGKDPNRIPLQVLEDLDSDLDTWKSALSAEMYRQFIGPRVTQQQAALQGLACEVLDFWLAMKNASHWFAELVWTVHTASPSRSRKGFTSWEELSQWTTTEEELVCELHEPSWTDSVRLVGVADAVIRLPDSGRWCGLEFKTGRTSPVADLAQACLYHLMLSTLKNGSAASTDGDQTGDLALVSFSPQRQEQVFSAKELTSARQRLIDLIGNLAGVKIAPSSKSTPVATPDPGTSPGSSSPVPSEEHLKMGETIVKTLAEYGVSVTIDQPVKIGPTFLRFPVTLGQGMIVKKVINRAEELQLRLGLKEAPFISCDEGQLVIDIQRPDREIVHFHDLAFRLPPANERGSACLPIGVNLFGELICADLSKPEHAHLLVAGTTGSGKSEWLRTALAGLLIRNSPETLRIVVIDPKRNAFHALRNSPYLLQPLVFPDEQPASEVLQMLAEEMDRRYRMLNGANSIADLPWNAEQPLPRIVCICDEYRDLISGDRQEKKRIETQICRLGAKARAAGIHLIMATQEPSRETIKGPLDSNFSARVGLKMQKDIESKMMFGEPGAERLLGHGDLLFRDVGKPRRLQAPLLSEDDRLKIFGCQGN